MSIRVEFECVVTCTRIPAFHSRPTLAAHPHDMAIRLRFAMHGLRNNRILHLVAIDHRKARNAKPVELLGIYKHRVEGPGAKKTLEWSVDRIRYWLNVGALPSPSVVRLLEMVCYI